MLHTIDVNRRSGKKQATENREKLKGNEHMGFINKRARRGNRQRRLNLIAAPQVRVPFSDVRTNVELGSRASDAFGLLLS